MPVKNLFGTSGIRGVTDQDITEEFCYKIACAYGRYLRKGRVVVGRDNRPGSARMLTAVKNGLIKAGLKIEDFDVLPSPELMFHLVRTKADGGVMITGSHLPINMLGIIPLRKDGSGVYGKEGEIISKMFYEQ